MLSEINVVRNGAVTVGTGNREECCAVPATQSADRPLYNNCKPFYVLKVFDSAVVPYQESQLEPFL